MASLIPQSPTFRNLRTHISFKTFLIFITIISLILKREGYLSPKREWRCKNRKLNKLLYKSNIT
ncbi:hypothetical protein B6U70_00185 [Euryarchaeota archaeon ex4484_162]|nr:MAG: hypothetical protein B6U70_00185 [Euryarchaeota archaeon ex4484_162]